MATYDILNWGGQADRLVIWRDDGRKPSDMPREVQDALLDDRDAFDRLEENDWVTVADGEVVELGEFHPFQVEAHDADVILDGKNYDSVYILEHSGAEEDIPPKLDGMVDPDEIDGGDWIVVTDHETKTGVDAHPEYLKIVE